MKIQKCSDSSFHCYGRVIKGIDTQRLVSYMETTPLPDDVIYEPSDEKMEQLPVYEAMSKSVYGGMPVQIGYCNGHNQKLNALEYHRSSEINLAVTDLILLIGKEQDIEEDQTYDTANVEAFLIPKGTMIEVYATTLHYAPCGVDGAGFRCVVVLPKGTNYPVMAEQNLQEQNIAEDRLLAATNKWLIAHKEAGIEGAFNGLKGDNITI